MVIQIYAPTSKAEEAEVKRCQEDLQELLELTPKNDVLSITGDWNAKVGNKETSGVTGTFGFGVQNEAGQRLIEFCQENALDSKNSLPTTQEKTTHGPHQMAKIKIKLIIFFAAKDGEALYSQQKQDWELIVAQIMNSYCQIQTEFEDSRENHQTIQS